MNTTPGHSVMRAAQYDRYGPASLLQVRTVPIPAPRPGHVVVRVASTTVNAADVIIRRGRLRLVTGRKFPRGTGFDFAGHVTAVGAKVTDVAVGDPVWGFIGGIRQGPSAAAAEYVLAARTAVARAPRTIDAVTAAALPGAAGSALAVLTRSADLQPGQRLLIRGAAGGVGTAAVQLASALGAHVTALARSEHHEALRGLGAAATFDYRTVDPADLGRFEAILDVVGTGVRPWRKLLTRRGRYLQMALGTPRDLAYLAASTMFGPRRVRFVQAPPDGKILTALAHRVDDGQLRPIIAQSFALSDISSAHQALEHGGALGKQLVIVDASATGAAHHLRPPTTRKGAAHD